LGFWFLVLDTYPPQQIIKIFCIKCLETLKICVKTHIMRFLRGCGVYKTGEYAGGVGLPICQKNKKGIFSKKGMFIQKLVDGVCVGVLYL